MQKVLIIEDTKSFSTMLSTLIDERYGYESVVVRSAAEATHMLGSYNEEFFVAIVDINLPDCNKGESVDIVNQYNIPALVFTNELNQGLREDIIFKGVADYTLKEGDHNIDYVVNMVNRIYHNYNTKILIVDDSESARKVIDRLLQLQRFKTVCVGSGEKALSILRKDDGFRITIVDFHMEGMDGLELTREIRKIRSPQDLSIVGMSGNVSKGLLASFIKKGADDFILKPFEQEEFLYRVNHIINTVDMTHRLDILNRQKNDLIEVAAHDIRGPMSIIKIAVEKMKTARDGKKIRQLLGMIEGNINNTLTLVDDILSVSAVESGRLSVNLSVENLSEIALEAATYHRLVAETKGLQFKLEINKLADMDFDMVRIRQLIDNLISNALKYSPVNSEITIRTFIEGNYQVFEVLDNGPGIAEEKLENLFQPYLTLGSKTTGDEKSTGLGLSICKKIITSHGGVLNYKKTSSGGSCFWFGLPYFRSL